MNFKFEHGSPESVGIPSEALTGMMNSLNQLNTLHGIMVLRHGKVCLEGWWKPYCPEIPHLLFSLSKSFVSMAIGLAQSEKRLALSDTVLSFFPEYESEISDPKMRELTLRHLLTMTTGHSVCAYADIQKDPDKNWVRGFFRSQLDHEPGTFFVYNTAATYLLSAVLQKVTGVNVREYLIPRLFEPLGIRPGQWENCPMGINKGGTGLYLKTEDLARVGQLLLQRGIWNGKTLLPADYLAEATGKQVDTATNRLPDWRQGYGYQFWISQHGFRGDGSYGQFIVVLPKEDMVIAATASANMQAMMDAFWALLPSLKDAPLPENAAVHSALLDITENLAIPHHQKGNSDGLPETVWQFQSNPAGITQVNVTFPDQTCRMEFHSRYGREILTAGFENMNYTSFLHLNDSELRPVVAQAFRTAPDKVDIELFCLDSPGNDVFHLNFSDPVHPLTAESGGRGVHRTGFLPELSAKNCKDI